MNLSGKEVLQTKATFMCLAGVLSAAKSNELTGCVRVNWNNSDARLKEWVENEILSDEVLKNSTGYITLKDGAIVGAKMGETVRADLDKSLNLLIQLCYGIGCGVLPSTVLSLEESELSETDVIRKFSELDLMQRIADIEGSIKQPEFA